MTISPKPRIWLITLIILLASALSDCTKKPSSLNIKNRARLDKLMEDSMRKFKAPGMLLAVYIQDQDPYVEARGLADIKTGRNLKVTDRFRIGSNTKTFTATVFLQLVDEGKIELNTTLDTFFPQFSGADKISMKMLLNHTSGIYNYSEDKKFIELLFSNPEKVFTPRNLIHFALRNKNYFKPGKDFHYSNTNTVLLGMIIEKLTNNTLAEAIHERIIKRLGLQNTFFVARSNAINDLCHGYMLENEKYVDWTRLDMSWGWAAGEIISNVSDLHQYITALTDGTFLSPKLQKERMTTWVKPGKNTMFPSARYGYNVFLFGGFIGHNGGLPGYISYMVRDPETRTSLIMMLNTQPRDSIASLEILKKVIMILYPERTI